MVKLLNETQVSEILQKSLATLRRWRVIGQGPEYIKVGPSVRYRAEVLEQWIDRLPSGGDGHRLAEHRGNVRRISARA